MAYGDRKMRKEAGDFGPVDFFGMGLSAAAGIVAAVVFDLTQHDDGSALFLINKWVARLTETVGLGSIPLYGVVLMLMAVGAASILFFQPVTMKGAFAQGFGALAALTTIAPSDLGTALPGPADIQPLPAAFEENVPSDEGETSVGQVIPAVYRAASAPALPMTAAYAATAIQREGYGLRMRIKFPESLPSGIEEMVDSGALRGRLHNETSGQTYNMFLSGGGDLTFENNTLFVSTMLPGSSANATIIARIEAEGYAIRVETIAVQKGANPVWTIEMEPSGRPLFLQRMNKSYRF